jgi:hypothetical protein
LLPRLSYVQRNAIASPEAGLIIYCNNCGIGGEVQLFNGTEWVNISGSAATQPLPPILAATTSATIVRGYNATSGGDVTSAGNMPMTERGIVWNTSSNPTIALTTKNIVSGTTGSFSSVISGLTPNTTYYVRSYATNSVGTSYGSQISFSSPQLTSDVFGFEGSGDISAGVVHNETIWRSSGAWNDIRSYNGTVYAGTNSWLVSFSSPSSTVELSNSYDFDAVSFYVKKDMMATSSNLTIKCYDSNNQQVGATITSSISTDYSLISININRIRKVVFSQDGTPPQYQGNNIYFDNLSFRQ